jgi:hypothetical protein
MAAWLPASHPKPLAASRNRPIIRPPHISQQRADRRRTLCTNSTVHVKPPTLIPPPAPVAPQPPPRVVERERDLDARQCRILLNAAQREIDRLRRGLARLPLHTLPPRPSVDSCQLRDEASRDTASAVGRPHMPPRLYAVDPVGRIPDLSRDKVQHVTLRVIHHHHITNLGTMVDALA